MRTWRGGVVAILTPVVLSGMTGCLASKGDIRLLQDELRVTRAQVATGDSAILRADAARQSQFASLAATLDRVNDSLRVLTARFAMFQANATGEFDAMGKQIVQVQALLGQTTRNMQEARAQLEALREQGTAPVATAPTVPAATATDTTQRGGPGPATLFTSAIEAFRNGSYRTARSGFEELVRTYPDYAQTPQAQVYIGDSYKSEGNTAAADSVYQLVETKNPDNAAVAPQAMYKHGLILWDANKRGEARIVFNRLITKFPNSDEAELAKGKVNPRE